jgi:flagellar assembly protein FliH
MLSKVLSGRDTERARPLIFAPLGVRTVSPSPDRDKSNDGGPRNDTLETENRQLRETAARLESEIAGARAEGFESGRRQGEVTARRDIAPVLERMTASIAEITSMRAELRRQAEKDVVGLSLLIAKRVLHRELSVDTNALTALARVVFERLTRAESYRVTVHPQFAPAIAGALTGSHAGRVHIEPDPGCAPGTLVIRSAEGLIDASIDAQLEEIGRGLTDRLAAG